MSFFPTSPSNNQTATVNGITYVYNSTLQAWKISPIVGTFRQSYTTSNTAPSSPTAGDLWYKIDQDILFEYISDGTSNNWVDITTPVLTSQPVTSSPSVDVNTIITYSYLNMGA